MPLRNVATTYTIEQQRLEINLLAGDVNNIATGSTSTTASSLAAGATGADLTLSGTLTVNGTQTILNTATLEVEDKNIVIAKGSTTDAAANTGGITLKGANDKTITYSSSGDKWVSNIAFQIENNLEVDGAVTSTAFLGNGSALTDLTAANLTGALPAIDGSALTGISVDSTKIETGNTKVETIDTGSDGHIKFTTEGTERIRITQDAGLTKFIQGATSTNSNTIFHVEGTIANGAEFIGNNTQQGFYLALQNKNTNTDAWTTIQSWDAGGQPVSSIRFIQVNDANNQGAIAFRTRDGSAGEQERLRIRSNGTVTATGAIEDEKGNVRTLPRNEPGAAYTAVTADKGKFISNGSDVTFDNSATWDTGDVITVFNYDGSNTIQIIQGTGFLMHWTDGTTASTGTRTLAAKGTCTLLCVEGSNNTFVISGALT